MSRAKYKAWVPEYCSRKRNCLRYANRLPIQQLHLARPVDFDCSCASALCKNQVKLFPRMIVGEDARVDKSRIKGAFVTRYVGRFSRLKVGNRWRDCVELILKTQGQGSSYDVCLNIERGGKR